MKINELRLLLYRLIEEKGLSDPETVKISQELDRLILKDALDFE